MPLRQFKRGKVNNKIISVAKKEKLLMNISFVYQWLQSSQFLLAVLTMVTLAVTPILPIWAQEDQSSQSSANTQSQPFPKGTYLYGQSPQPDQIGSEYVVFEVTQEKIIGVLYMPHSEFSCFQGKISGNELEMVVDHPYEDTTHPYDIALEASSPIASGNGELEASMTLQGYHPLEGLSENDQRMLATCQKEFQ